MKSVVKIAVASALYFASHSALASFKSKDLATRATGQRNRDGLYRLFYSAISSAGLVALFFYGRALPDRRLYTVKGWNLLLTIPLQLLGLAMVFDATRKVRAARLFGVENAVKWREGDDPEAAPESQTPPAAELSKNRDLARDGVFALTRNAFNFAVVPLFCAWPRMTANYASFCALMTAYCVLGSWLGERRMSARYGVAWDEYKAGGTPFFLPSFPKKEAASDRS